MQNAIMRTITDKLFLFLLVFLVLCMTDMSYAQTVTDDGKGICKTLDNLEKILTGISVVVVTLAVMWAGYKFLFTRAEVAECGKILAAGVMIGSASTIAGWFMGKNKTCEDALQGIGVDANELINGYKKMSCPAAVNALTTNTYNQSLNNYTN